MSSHILCSYSHGMVTKAMASPAGLEAATRCLEAIWRYALLHRFSNAE